MNKWILCILAALVAGVAGCEGYDDDQNTRGGRTYIPPAGLGAIVVENDSPADWNVEIDSIQIGRVASNSFLVRDASPGNHLIHLDEDEGRNIEDRAITVEAGLIAVVRVHGDASDYGVDLFSVSP